LIITADSKGEPLLITTTKVCCTTTWKRERLSNFKVCLHIDGVFEAKITHPAAEDEATTAADELFSLVVKAAQSGMMIFRLQYLLSRMLPSMVEGPFFKLREHAQSYHHHTVEEQPQLVLLEAAAAAGIA
jgi:hypothetical protein